MITTSAIRNNVHTRITQDIYHAKTDQSVLHVVCGLRLNLGEAREGGVKDGTPKLPWGSRVCCVFVATLLCVYSSCEARVEHVWGS